MPDTVHVHTKCPGCQKQATLEVPAEGYKRWRNGELIQRALPELSASQREQLMTGYCVGCWDRLFAEEDEDGY